MTTHCGSTSVTSSAEKASVCTAGTGDDTCRPSRRRTDRSPGETGAAVVEVPTTFEVSGSRRLQHSLCTATAVRLNEFDWVVITSVNGAHRFTTAAAPASPVPRRRGPRRAEHVAGQQGCGAPHRTVRHRGCCSEHSRRGRAAACWRRRKQPVQPIAEGLRAKGWTVDAVVAYSTAPARPRAANVVARASACGRHHVHVRTVPRATWRPPGERRPHPSWCASAR